jgi:hypothetical protein
MQYEIIFGEITGGVPVHKHPGTDKESPALSVRYETKEGRQEMRIYGARLSNWNGENTEVSRSHSSQTPRVMPWTR